jgi:hypothetical protein
MLNQSAAWVVFVMGAIVTLLGVEWAFGCGQGKVRREIFRWQRLQSLSAIGTGCFAGRYGFVARAPLRAATESGVAVGTAAPTISVIEVPLSGEAMVSVFRTHTLPEGSTSMSVGTSKLLFWKPPPVAHAPVVVEHGEGVLPVGDSAVNVALVPLPEVEISETP